MLECLQVIQEMFDKAFSSSTMDYELIFWGYTVAIKKITWFAQVCKLCLLLNFKIFFQRQFTSFLFARLKTRKVYFFRILTRCSTSSQRDSSKAKPAICMNNSTTSVCLTPNIWTKLNILPKLRCWSGINSSGLPGRTVLRLGIIKYQPLSNVSSIAWKEIWNFYEPIKRVGHWWASWLLASGKTC